MDFVVVLYTSSTLVMSHFYLWCAFRKLALIFSLGIRAMMKYRRAENLTAVDHALCILADYPVLVGVVLLIVELVALLIWPISIWFRIPQFRRFQRKYEK